MITHIVAQSDRVTRVAVVVHGFLHELVSYFPEINIAATNVPSPSPTPAS